MPVNIQRRPSKYRAVPIVVDGIRFHSKKEARRYQELKLLEKAGEIHDLQLQYEYPLMVRGRGNGWADAGECIGKYVADFRYREGPRGLLVVEDVKGVRTALYKWKRRHVEAQYGITIRET